MKTEEEMEAQAKEVYAKAAEEIGVALSEYKEGNMSVLLRHILRAADTIGKSGAVDPGHILGSVVFSSLMGLGDTKGHPYSLGGETIKAIMLAGSALHTIEQLSYINSLADDSEMSGVSSFAGRESEFKKIDPNA